MSHARTPLTSRLSAETMPRPGTTCRAMAWSATSTARPQPGSRRLHTLPRAACRLRRSPLLHERMPHGRLLTTVPTAPLLDGGWRSLSGALRKSIRCSTPARAAFSRAARTAPASRSLAMMGGAAEPAPLALAASALAVASPVTLAQVPGSNCGQ